MGRRTYSDRIIGLERVRAGDLLANPANWRTHPDSQVSALRGLLSEVGWAQALLAYRSNGDLKLIDGHLRAGLDPDEQVPVLILDVDDSEAEKLLVSIDPLAAMAEADSQALRGLLERVETADAGLGALLADLNAQAAPKQGRTDPDDVPQDVEPRTKPGDLWLLGEHRLLCGDATNRADYERLLDGLPVNAVLTDPPYGVNLDYTSAFEDSRENVLALIEGFMPLVLEFSPVVLVTSGHTLMFSYPAPTWVLGWFEPAGVGMGPWGFTCSQPVLAYGQDPYLARGLGSRPDSFVGRGEGPSSEQHPVAKPMEVWTWLLERCTTRAGQVVLDPFMGSGTTVIAAETTSRRALGLELDPGYCDVAVARWEQFTGEQAVLDA